MSPPLDKNIPLEDFQAYYWMGEELVIFCRTYGLSTQGPKLAMSSRIETFLSTGEIIKPKQTKITPLPKLYLEEELSLETVIPVGHKCSQRVREFFNKEIPGFYFSTSIQSFFKENTGKTYDDAVKEWYRLKEIEKRSSKDKIIPPQFEFNTFVRDFFKDPKNKGRTRKEAIIAWENAKKQRGSNKYES